MRAAACWEAALALNPLHSSGWFSLGHCYLKFEELDKAVQVSRAITNGARLQGEVQLALIPSDSLAGSQDSPCRLPPPPPTPKHTYTI